MSGVLTGSEAGSYLRLIDFAYHSTPGLRVIQKRRRRRALTGPRSGAPSISWKRKEGM